MTVTDTMTRGRPRVIVQYLEGGAAPGAIEPGAAVARLRRAASIVPIDDVCLGWGLPPALVEPVAAAARGLRAAVWLWHPLLSGDGRYTPGPWAAIGLDGRPVAAPRGLAEFAFDCANQPDARTAALGRLAAAIDGGPWDGVFLDKIRWPSPFADPASSLACTGPHCAGSLRDAGVDLDAVRHLVHEATLTPGGRVMLATGLVGGDLDPVLDDWFRWRSDTIAGVVDSATRLIRRRGLRVAFDVFAPSLARAVGQDIATLAPPGDFTKAMLYLGTHGPAGMAKELADLGAWMAAGGVERPGEVLGQQLGYPVPEPDELRRGQLPAAAFSAELRSLVDLAGRDAAAGIDAVAIPDLALLDDAGLEAVAGTATAQGVPLVLSWDLWHISDARLSVIADAVARSAATPGPVA